MKYIFFYIFIQIATSCQFDTTGEGKILHIPLFQTYYGDLGIKELLSNPELDSVTIDKSDYKKLEKFFFSYNKRNKTNSVSFDIRILIKLKDKKGIHDFPIDGFGYYKIGNEIFESDSTLNNILLKYIPEFSSFQRKK